MELFDSLLTATDNWGGFFMILVARLLMVLVAALTWQTVDNGGTLIAVLHANLNGLQLTIVILIWNLLPVLSIVLVH